MWCPIIMYQLECNLIGNNIPANSFVPSHYFIKLIRECFQRLERNIFETATHFSKFFHSPLNTSTATLFLVSYHFWLIFSVNLIRIQHFSTHNNSVNCLLSKIIPFLNATINRSQQKPIFQMVDHQLNVLYQSFN